MDNPPPSAPTKSSRVIRTALLTVAIAAFVPGVIGSLYNLTHATANVKGAGLGMCLLLLLFTFYFGTALCFGSLFAWPILLWARISRRWHAAVMALLATVASYVLSMAGVTNFISGIFHIQTSASDLLPLSGAVILGLIQFLLLSGVCVAYRRCISNASGIAGA